MSDVIRRPDLEEQEVTLPGYIIPEILPPLEKTQQAGTLYYWDYAADNTAQSGRNTGTQAAITNNKVAASTTTFACAEIRARHSMSYSEVMGYKSLEHAELALGRMSKRSWYNKVEIDGAKALLDVDSPAVISTDILGGIEAAVGDLMDLAVGGIGIAMSNRNFISLKNTATIQKRAQAFTTAVVDGKPAKVTPEAMAAVFGVDKVLVGTDANWYTGLDAADRDNIAVFVLPDKDVDCREQIQLGRIIYYAWDGAAKHFIMESFHDPLSDIHVVDAKGLITTKILNGELVKTLKLTANA